MQTRTYNLAKRYGESRGILSRRSASEKAGRQDPRKGAIIGKLPCFARRGVMNTHPHDVRRWAA